MKKWIEREIDNERGKELSVRERKKREVENREWKDNTRTRERERERKRGGERERKVLMQQTPCHSEEQADGSTPCDASV